MRSADRSRSPAGRTPSSASSPAEAQLPEPAEIFIPLEYDDTFDAGNDARAAASEFLASIGRARAGVGAEAIEADLQRVGTQLQTAFPESNGGLTFTSTPLREMIVGDVQRPLLVLLGAVGFVLLVACANVANLLLARGSARHGELAVRAAVGAGRARLVRQLVTEAIVLGLVGGVLGLLIAYVEHRSAHRRAAGRLCRGSTRSARWHGRALHPRRRAAHRSVFGMVPALQATNEHLLRGLQESGRAGGGGRRAHRLRSALVVAEMALAVVLLTGDRAC